MKKLLGIALLAMLFGGCATTQDKIDTYIKVRSKAINTSKVVKCEKDCFKKCNILSNDIDRVDCKARCVEDCHK